MLAACKRQKGKRIVSGWLADKTCENPGSSITHFTQTLLRLVKPRAWAERAGVAAEPRICTLFRKLLNMAEAWPPALNSLTATESRLVGIFAV